MLKKISNILVRIKNVKKEQLGGFKTLEIIKLSDIIFCPYILTNKNSDKFTYKKYFESDVSVLPVGETIYMSSKSKKKNSGILYKLEAGFDVNFLSEDLDTIFNEYHLTDVIVKATTYNNNAIIYGSVLFPLKFYYQVLHSKKIENPTKYKVMCKAEISQKPVIVKV